MLKMFTHRTHIGIKWICIFVCLSVLLLVVCPCNGVGWQSRIKLSNNGLSGLLVAIDPSVPEDATLVPTLIVCIF